MKYTQASHVLPDELIKEIQKYVEGEVLYIQKVNETPLLFCEISLMYCFCFM